MGEYRLWYVKRGENQQGPFPEPLICRYILNGRVGGQDLLSLDGHFWLGLDQLPDLRRAVDAMLHAHAGADDGDVDWRAERAKAALRWLDDRKSPDPRGKKQNAVAVPRNDRRRRGERRLAPEAAEHQAYRESRATFESWVRARRQRYGRAVVFVLIVGSLIVSAALLLKPVNPIRVGIRLQQADCTMGAAKGVNWSACDKSGALLVGVDLRGAELVGTRLGQANLRYADLSQANLSGADLSGADLTGVRLEGATWTDGRLCAAGSLGVCR